MFCDELTTKQVVAIEIVIGCELKKCSVTGLPNTSKQVSVNLVIT